MPFYTYQCEDCQNTTTALRAVSLRNRPVRCTCGKLCAQAIDGFGFIQGWRIDVRFYSLPQKLAGNRVMMPKTAGPTSVLGHACHSGCGCNSTLDPLADNAATRVGRHSCHRGADRNVCPFFYYSRTHFPSIRHWRAGPRVRQEPEAPPARAPGVTGAGAGGGAATPTGFPTLG